MTAVPLQNDDADESGPLREHGEHRMRLTEHSAQVDLRTVLQLCAAGKLRCSEKTMRPSAATVGTIADHLTSGDFYADEPIASFAWPLLVQAGGLARIEQGRLQLTPKGRAALKKTSADVIRSLWQSWLRHAPIDEFNRIEAIKGQRSRNVLSAATRRRQTVAAAIAQLPQGEWIDTYDLFDTMQHSDLSPTIARNQMSMWKLYLLDAQYGSLGYDGYHRWEIVEGRYTLAVLFEYAGTLGLLDLEYVHPAGARNDFRDNWGADSLAALSRYDGLEAIRVNALGAYALGITDSYSPPADDDATRVLKILPNLDIVATGALSATDALLLSAYAAQTADRVWTVSAASLLAALHTGRDLTEFTTFLARRAENDHRHAREPPRRRTAARPN